MKTNRHFFIKIALLLSIIDYQGLKSCTGILLKTSNNNYVYGRTLEFGEDLKSEILFIPRGYHLTALTPSQQPEGLSWDSKYAAVGTNAYNLTGFVDAINEKGLAGGLFYFPGFAKYQEVNPDQYKQSLPMWFLLTWILTNFENIQEIKAAITKILVSNASYPGSQEIIPAHLIIHDESGKCIVIEYVDGKLNIHDNPIGIITNSPAFDWHMTNLRNYINLSPVNSMPNVFNGTEFAQLGQGSGMHGLPGDFTPPSRFVRAAAFVQSSPTQATELDAVKHAFHILNNFDIPKGSVMSKDGVSEYTSWTSVTDIKNRVFYFKTYDNFQIQKIDLTKLDLNSKDIKKYSMNRKEEIIDLLK